VRELQIRNPLASAEYKQEVAARMSGDEGTSTEEDVPETSFAASGRSNEEDQASTVAP
jgi:hypothetical protein